MMKKRIAFAVKLVLAIGLMIALSFWRPRRAGRLEPGQRACDGNPFRTQAARGKPTRKAWNRREDGSPMLYGDGWFDDSGYFFAILFNEEAADQGSLEQVVLCLRVGRRRGLEVSSHRPGGVPRDDPTAPQQITQLHLSIGGLHMYEGNFDVAVAKFQAARDG